MGMIADMIMPIVRVGKQSDSYNIWSQADALRTEDDNRAPGTEANLISMSVDSAVYFADNYALKMGLTLEDRENADAAFLSEIREGRVMRIMDKLMLNWEVRVANLVTSTSNVGSSSTVTSAWTDYTDGNSDPLGNVWTAIDNVEDATGYRPNRIVFGAQAWRNFRRHKNVIDTVNGDSGIVGPSNVRGTVSQQQVAAVLEMEQILVGRAYQNTNEEDQSISLSSIWADNVLIYYAPMRPSRDVPSFAYSFRWQKPSIPNMAVERHPYDTKTKSEEIEAGYYQDEKITSAPLAFLLNAVNSSQ
jgi:hypothetical protein